MGNDNGERKLPTRAGWWWRQGRISPYVEEVAGDQNHDLFIPITGGPIEDDGTWLAPIPGPEVCAAVVEWYAAHELDCTEAGHQDRFWDAEIALADAIRAEVDGAA